MRDQGKASSATSLRACAAAMLPGRVRGRRLLVSAMLVSALALAAVGPAAPAQAAVTHELTGSFPISFPIQIAVDEATGQVYVFQAFGENGYFEPGIRRFDANGNPSIFSALGTNQVDGCCAGTSDADQAPSNGIGSLQNGGPWQIAIDNSPGATQHDLIVPDLDELVFFDSTGTYLATLKTSPGEACGAATDPAGSLYIGHQGADFGPRTPESSTVSRYTPGPHTQPAKFKDNSHLFPRERGVCNVAADSTGGTYINRSKVLGIVGGQEEPLEYYAANLFDLVLEDPTEGYVGVFGREIAEKSATFSVETGTDDLYATEGNRVVRYDPEGHPIETFGDGDFEHGVGIAANGATGRVYVSNLTGSDVLMYDEVVTPDITEVSAQAGQTGATVKAHVAPAGEPTVTECTVEYGPTTEYGSSVPCGGVPYSAGTDVSVDLTGMEIEAAYHYRVTAANANGVHEGIDHTLVTHAVGDVATGQPSAITRASATLNGSFTGNGEETTVFFEWGETAEYGSSTPHATFNGVGGQQVSAGVTELLPNTADAGTYHFRLVASNSKGTSYGEDVEFHTLPPAIPTVGSSAVTSISETAVTLVAQVNPQAGTTGVRFEYGPSEGYGSVAEIVEPLAADTGSHEVSTGISGLSPGTTYHFRAVASNFAGAAFGQDVVFNTPAPPEIVDQGVSGIGSTGATLGATLRPGFQATSYHFEYGPNLGYGSSAGQGVLGAGDDGAHQVGGPVAGLSPGVTYHFRIVASNPSGEVIGPDRTFMTAPLPVSEEGGQLKCKKGFVKRHGKCVHSRHKRHKHRKTRSGSHG